MANYSKKQDDNYRANNEIVEALLQLPSKNLEVRIRGLEREIEDRQKMKNHILSKLETFKGQLKDNKRRLNYISHSGQSTDVLQKVASDLLKIDINIAGELRECFRDISRLKERIQEAGEDLEIEKRKLSVILDKKKNGNHRRIGRFIEKT